MTEYSPKQNFLNWQPTAAAELQKQRESLWFTVSLSYALAELTHKGASSEQLTGARNFIAVLQNLWERPGEAAKLPAQTLKSYEQR